MKGQKIIVNDLGKAPTTGTPVSLIADDGTEIGRYASVIDAYHASTLTSGEDGIGEQASGAYDNVTGTPAGTFVDSDGAYVSDHPGTVATDAPSPLDYSCDPAQSAATGIETPLYGAGFTTSVTQHWTGTDPVTPANIGNGASFNPDCYPNLDIAPSAPLTHPAWHFPYDPNA